MLVFLGIPDKEYILEHFKFKYFDKSLIERSDSKPVGLFQMIKQQTERDREYAIIEKLRYVQSVLSKEGEEALEPVMEEIFITGSCKWIRITY
jgi:hypothetical protein